MRAPRSSERSRLGIAYAQLLAVRPIPLCLALSLGTIPAVLSGGSAMAGESEESMAKLVRVRSKSLSVCYALDDSDVTRKGQLAVEIQPGGEVSAVTIDDSLPARVAGCVAQRIRTWKFPAFIGEPRKLRWLLILVGGGEK